MPVEKSLISRVRFYTCGHFIAGALPNFLKDVFYRFRYRPG